MIQTTNVKVALPDQFNLTRVLGQGKYGTVYLADDQQHARKVVIKVARPEKQTAQRDEHSFVTEARCAARVCHPNVVSVLESGEFKDGDGNVTPYLVTEYIDGQTLGELLRSQTKMSADQYMTLIRKLAEALDHVHAQGVVHLDIKPDNVLIDKDGQPHIVDFGFACCTGDAIDSGSNLGSPAYMSPERMPGQRRTPDRRADIWSLGIIIYEMLTGRRPFEGTITQVLMGIHKRNVVPLRNIDDSIPPELEAICLKCLQRNPDERFSTAGELADTIACWEQQTLSRLVFV